MEERLDRIIDLLEELKAGLLPEAGWDCTCEACRQAVVPSEEVLNKVEAQIKGTPELAVVPSGPHCRDDLECYEDDWVPEGA